jgi:hypothetical protein
MNSKDGMFRQRVGALVEIHICGKYNLFFNKRQQVLGFYDAYDKDYIYEIKASNNSYNTFILKVKNHKLLVDAQGYYIFVSYILKNTDKELKLITDIEIQKVYKIAATDINDLIKKNNIPINKKDKNTNQFKIQLSMIEKAKNKVLI